MTRQLLLLIAVLGFGLAYAISDHSEYNKKRSVRAITVILTLFSGLRTWWFGDLIKYYTLYRSCNGEGWVQAVFGKFNNIGIRLFFRISGFFLISYDVCIFLIAAFVAVTLGILVYRYSPSPYWSYLIYISLGFYIFTYSGLKQAIAMGFCCIAFFFIVDRRPWMFTLFVVIAGLFHFPALVFLLAYPIAHKRIDRYYFWIVVGGLLLVFLLRDPIVRAMSKLYYDDEDAGTAKELIGGRFLMMIAIILVSLMIRQLNNYDREYRYVFNLMIAAAALQSFSVYDNNFTRLADYYYQFSVLFIPMMLEPDVKRRRSAHQFGGFWSFDSPTYGLLCVFITGFALWFYWGQIQPGTIIDGFKFFWEINAHALYGT